MIIKDKNIKLQFVKDFKLPINVLKEENFQYLLDLLEPYYKSRTRYKYLLNILDELGENSFPQYFAKLKSSILDDIKNKDSYKLLGSDNSILNVYNNIKYQDIKSGNIYNNESIDKTFISIDLTKANFQSMKFYNPEIINNKDTYESFISNYIEELKNKDYFLKSKQLRQVIFGNLNPKRQQLISQNLLTELIDFALEINIEPEKIKKVGSDEFVIYIDNENELCEIIEYFNAFQKKSYIDFTIEPYHLRCANEKHKFYIREMLSLNNNDVLNIDFKNIPGIFVPQVIKQIEERELNDFDMMFYHEKHLCQFVEPIDIEYKIKKEEISSFKL